MVALASLPYPFVAVISYKARTRPRKLIVQSSIRVPSSPSKLTKRKNYLRPKILKTLTKPFPIPSPTPADPMTPTQSVEPSVEVLKEPVSEYLDSGIVEQSEELVGINESDSVEFQVVGQVSEAQHVDFSWFSGRTVVRIVASFVGLFVLQTAVAIWIMGSGDFDEKDKNLGIESRRIDHGLGIRDVEVGLDGDALGNSAGLNVDDSEIEAKIAEIRKMAREARELEKKSLENGEGDTGYDSDDDGEGLVMEASRLQSGIVKEVDRRVTKLWKSSPATLMNVKFLNKEQDTMKEAKNRGLEDKDENDMLMFEMKHRFTSHLAARSDKPKEFQRIKGSRDMGQKPKNVDGEQLIKTNENQSGQNASSSDEDREINGLDSSFPERIDPGSEMNEKKSGTQSSNSLETTKKRSGCDSGARKLNEGSNGLAPSQALKKLSGSNSATEKLNKRINEDTKPEKGVIQDNSCGNPGDLEANLKYSRTVATQNSQMKMVDPKASATSEMHTLSVPLSSDELGSSLSMRNVKDKQQIGDSNPWWLTLPYVLVVLMQKGLDGGGLEGFFTLRFDSDTENQSYRPHIVAFEARNDARNFSYLLNRFLRMYQMQA